MIYAQNGDRIMTTNCVTSLHPGWQCGVVVSGVRRINEVNASGPVSTWMGDRLWAGIPSRYVTSQLRQLSLASLRGRLIEYQLRLG